METYFCTKSLGEKNYMEGVECVYAPICVCFVSLLQPNGSSLSFLKRFLNYIFENILV